MRHEYKLLLAWVHFAYTPQLWHRTVNLCRKMSFIAKCHHCCTRDFKPYLGCSQQIYNKQVQHSAHRTQGYYRYTYLKCQWLVCQASKLHSPPLSAYQFHNYQFAVEDSYRTAILKRTNIKEIAPVAPDQFGQGSFLRPYAALSCLKEKNFSKTTDLSARKLKGPQLNSSISLILK